MGNPPKPRRAPPKRKATPKTRKGAKKGRPEPDGPLRLRRNAIAKLHGKDRGTLQKYLSLPGAPIADAAGKYDVAAVLAWMDQNAKTSHGSSEIRTLRESVLRVEAESKAFDLGVKKGAYVEREKIAPTIAAFMAQLTADMQAKFERELPAKYEGKTLAERIKLNADGIDFIMRRLKSGARPLVGKETAA